MAVPTGLNAVSAIMISPAMVPSVISTPSGAPTLRTFFSIGGYGGRLASGCWGGPAYDT